jgi:hypothetical protein
MIDLQEQRLLAAGFESIPVATLNGTQRIWAHPQIEGLAFSTEQAEAVLESK